MSNYTTSQITKITPLWIQLRIRNSWGAKKIVSLPKWLLNNMYCTEPCFLMCAFFNNINLSLQVLGSQGPLRLWPTYETFTHSPTLTLCFSIHFRAHETGWNPTSWYNNYISILIFTLNGIMLLGSSNISPLLLSRVNNRGHFCGQLL